MTSRAAPAKKPRPTKAADPRLPAAEYVSLDRLRPWAKNPRKNDPAVDGVVASIKRWGFGTPLLARRENGEIIAGHTRLKAAIKLGLPVVPVRYLDITEKEAHLLALADNKLGEKAAWDDSALLEILQGYGAGDIGIAGWDDKELKSLEDAVFKAKEIIEDDPPDPPKNPISKLGDVWTLGRHKVRCGDASQGFDALLDPGQMADMVFTDPPYGVDYVGKTKDALVVHNDGAATLPALLAGAFDATLTRTKAGGIWFVCAPPGPNMQMFAEALLQRELWRQSITWAKDVFVMGRSDYHYQHEQIFYGWKPGGPHRPPPDRKQSTLWTFERPKRSEHHPTMKPVKLVAHAIEMATVPGELVLEPFGGSGTTLIAAEQLDRACRAIEIAPAYVDVIVERWEKLTGGKATRAKGGKGA
jgi:site-specific DNA-methyltransferase (adenine-specific)